MNKVKIKMLQTAAGPEFGYMSGSVQEVDKKLAAEWVKDKAAEYVKTESKAEPKALETADTAAPETAAKPHGGKGKRGRSRKGK